MKVIHTNKLSFIIVAAATIMLARPIAMVSAEDGNTTLNVNVEELLSVSITTPTEWASGDIDDFLTNKISLSVISNNSAGFTASMATKTTNTSLTNTSKSSYVLPTLSSTTYPSGVARSSFPANYWGYSLDDTDAGNDNSTYNAIASSEDTPITLLSSQSATTGAKTLYFGAKADATQAAGTYTGTVVISVVSGVVDNSTNPITPVNPVTPGGDQVAVYDDDNDVTHYTYTRRNTSAGTSTTTTEVSSGNNVSAYEGYTPPQGVTYRASGAKQTTGTNSALAAGLGITAAVAATSGIFFLVAARRDDDDDEENK